MRRKPSKPDLRAAEVLLCIASHYETDGEPGELGVNCWGWRNIATHLREVADILLGEKEPPWYAKSKYQ